MRETFFIVGIGASAGGLDALKEFFSELTPTTSAAFVVISHLPTDYPTQLDTILSRNVTMPITLIEHDMAAVPGRIYIMPGHLRVTLRHDVLLARDRSAAEKINTAIDEFFYSLAKDKGRKAIGVVLSGMGSDGAGGAKAIHDKGGLVMVQDPASAGFSSMPIATINADDPQVIVRPAQLARYLNDMFDSELVNASRQRQRHGL